jgi:hypothetical protein
VTLAQEGQARGYFPDEIVYLRNHLQRGAYEWLVSLGEARRWRERLGDRMDELTYTQLTREPAETLREICKVLDLYCPQDWLDRTVRRVRPEKQQASANRSLDLPPKMAEQFNALQEIYGFEGRARVMDL